MTERAGCRLGDCALAGASPGGDGRAAAVIVAAGSGTRMLGPASDSSSSSSSSGPDYGPSVSGPESSSSAYGPALGSSVSGPESEPRMLASGLGKKQYADIMGLPVLAWAIRAFSLVDSIDEIVVVVASGEEGICRRVAVDPVASCKPVRVVAGGSDRRASVERGLAAVSPGCGVVAVHDGARPFPDPHSIAESVEEAWRSGAACVAVPVTDTIKLAARPDGEACDAVAYIASTPDRSSIWAAQTPQTFRREVLAKALLRAKQDGAACTDDASMAERLGVRVAIVAGTRENIKITVPSDLAVARSLAAYLFGSPAK